MVQSVKIEIVIFLILLIVLVYHKQFFIFLVYYLHERQGKHIFLIVQLLVWTVGVF